MLYKPLLAMYHNVVDTPCITCSIWHFDIADLIRLVQVGTNTCSRTGLHDDTRFNFRAVQGKHQQESNHIDWTAPDDNQVYQYTLALLGFVIVSNMSGLDWIKTTSFVWLSLIELKSIAENLSDKKWYHQ